MKGMLTEYIVEPGDSLYLIGKKYGVSPEVLMQYNHLQNDIIYPNQVLFIPYGMNPSSEKYYITIPGDTFESVMKKTKKRYEDLKSLKLVEGQKILYKNPQTHIVRPSDTVESVLNEYQLSFYDLFRLNSNDWLKPGSEIQIK